VRAEGRMSEASQEQVCPTPGFDGSAVLIGVRSGRFTERWAGAREARAGRGAVLCWPVEAEATLRSSRRAGSVGWSTPRPFPFCAGTFSALA